VRKGGGKYISSKEGLRGTTKRSTKKKKAKNQKGGRQIKGVEGKKKSMKLGNPVEDG